VVEEGSYFFVGKKACRVQLGQLPPSFRPA
jgi:hypothetical protein